MTAGHRPLIRHAGVRAAVGRAAAPLMAADHRIAARLAGDRSPLPTRYEISPLTFDVALRYREVIDLLRPLYRPGMEILEVGSGAGGVTDFLQAPVTGVDTAFERTADRATPFLTPVTASADALPFGDAEFDAVLCVEMLEHIPGDRREAVLSELFRVVRPGGRVVVTFPADAPAARLDRELNERHRRRHGTDHPWVIEHIQEGVPATDDVVATLRGIVGEQGSVAVHKHDPARSWLLHQTLYGAQCWYRPAVLAGLHTRVGATLLFQALRRTRGRERYRSIVVVDRARPTV
jgi:SAM-dependent methyltransferase